MVVVAGCVALAAWRSGGGSAAAGMRLVRVWWQAGTAGSAQGLVLTYDSGVDVEPGQCYPQAVVTSVGTMAWHVTLHLPGTPTVGLDRMVCQIAGKEEVFLGDAPESEIGSTITVNDQQLVVERP